MAKARPRTMSELKKIDGFGEAQGAKYGEAFLKTLQMAPVPKGEIGCDAPVIAGVPAPTGSILPAVCHTADRRSRLQRHVVDGLLPLLQFFDQLPGQVIVGRHLQRHGSDGDPGQPAGDPPKDPELTLAAWLIRELDVPPPADVQPFREALRELSEGQDFGPSPEASAAERRTAANEWFAWWAGKQVLPSYAKLNQAGLLAELHSPSPFARWAALRTARQRNMDIVAECIAALRDDSPMVHQAARATLIELSGGEDHGPAPYASEVERAKSIVQWNGWLQRKQLERREGDAVKALGHVDMLRRYGEKNKRWGDEEYRDRVKQRLQEIITRYPETQSATEAQQQLRQLE